MVGTGAVRDLEIHSHIRTIKKKHDNLHTPQRGKWRGAEGGSENRRRMEFTIIDAPRKHSNSEQPPIYTDKK